MVNIKVDLIVKLIFNIINLMFHKLNEKHDT